MSNTAATGAPSTETFYRADDFLIHLRQAHGLKLSKSAFLNGVRAGKYPQPLRITPMRPVWRSSDAAALIASF